MGTNKTIKATIQYTKNPGAKNRAELKDVLKNKFNEIASVLSTHQAEIVGELLVSGQSTVVELPADQLAALAKALEPLDFKVTKNSCARCTCG